MKNHNSDGFEIIPIVLSLVLTAFTVFAVGNERVAYFAARWMLVGVGYTNIANSNGTQKGENEAQGQNIADTQEQDVYEINEDITKTPSDIKALIKKYTEICANDTKDADIEAKSYSKLGATDYFKNVYVKNTTETKNIDIEKELSVPLELTIDKSKPSVLIFHSHTSEGYEMIERSWYAQDQTSRSNDENVNIVRVGTEIANYLTDLGYTVIHDKTIYDTNYSDSYPNSRKSVEKYLAEYPELEIILDIHRDSMQQNDGTKIKPVTEINGKQAAQLMIITGAQEGKIEDFPDWEYNRRFALRLQQKCETMFPGLMRPILFSPRKYNMDMTHFGLLIEVGSEANTLDEACYSARMLALALGDLMDEYVLQSEKSGDNN